MKALSVRQPWATLIALGQKRVETRDWACWPAVVGQRIAIHAGQSREHLDVCFLEPFSTVLATLGLEDVDDFPLGAIVATAVVDRSPQMTQRGIWKLQDEHPLEYAFGTYSFDRYAWVLRDVVALAEPLPFRGRQKFFEVPDRLLASQGAAA